ncbi:hypothetical protein [Acinetobacter pullicarnis]|uniref:hypothetical protein n=1 Tax=Acinetobacter pullicarnis TaxID=2576829 RepID=UPI00111F754A|nr:hypothetical protein [Acinetobacter pullicarnis]
MLLPTLELPDVFVLYNREDHFVKIDESETDIDFIEDQEGKKYIGIRISGLEINSSNAFIIDILQEKDSAGEHLYQVYEVNNDVQLSDYLLTKATLLNTQIQKLELMFCSSYLFNEI